MIFSKREKLLPSSTANAPRMRESSIACNVSIVRMYQGPRKSWQKGKIFRSLWRRRFLLHNYLHIVQNQISSAQVSKLWYVLTLQLATGHTNSSRYIWLYVVLGLGAYVLQIWCQSRPHAFTQQSRSLNFIKFSQSPPTYIHNTRN